MYARQNMNFDNEMMNKLVWVNIAIQQQETFIIKLIRNIFPIKIHQLT